MPISTNVAVVVGLASSQPGAMGSTTTAGVYAIFNYTTLVGGATETAWSLDIGSGASASYLFEFDVCAVSDDFVEHSAYKVIFAARWDGATVTQTAAAHAVITDETAPASSACTADISGTTIRLRVGTVADWRYGGTVRYTRTTFT